LPEEDEAYLYSLGLPWETIQDGGQRWLLIHEHPLPVGYNVEKAIVAIRIEGGYPPGPLDMVYFFPELSRADGKAITAPSQQVLDGRTFQRWSRHYPWRDGIDTLATHHHHIKGWLEKEALR
jgi:hypothetical protein